MSWFIHEMRLLMRARLAVAALVLLSVLSGLAVYAGLTEIAQQKDTIARIDPLNDRAVNVLSKAYAGGGDAGYAAYYTFYTTWDAPTDAAFLALGLRDVAPYVLRIRALGLHAQLYEGEMFNPELALPGKFDFAFVLIYLAPLFIIVLLHDLLSSERQSGRLRLLLTMAGTGGAVWYQRIGLRVALVLLALLLPVVVGAIVAGAGIHIMLITSAIVLAYVLFWSGISLLVAALGRRSSTNAMVLMASWVVVTLVLPALLNVVMLRAIPVNQGVDLMLAQRQNINGAWDVSRDATMTAFFNAYPEWKDTAPLPNKFHWKWYYAFQQLGDMSVTPQATAYRQGLLARDTWTSRAGFVLPGVGAQVLLHRLAATDLQAQLAYQDNIAAFHQQIRTFYYPYIFNELKFDVSDFAKRPRYAIASTDNTLVLWQLWLLLGTGLGMFAAGLLLVVKKQRQA
jgi:ABC-2 type transport system permease protein